MYRFVVLVFVCFTAVARAEDKPPSKVSSEDQREMFIMQILEENDQLRLQLAQCQSAVLQTRVPEATQKREEQRANILKKYKLDKKDKINPDGTIVRGK